MKLKHVLPISIILAVCNLCSAQNSEQLADYLLSRTNNRKGFCTILETRLGGIALPLAKKSDFLVYAQASDYRQIQKMRLEKESIELLNKRLYYSYSLSNTIGISNKYSDLLLVTDLDNDLISKLSAKELVRVISSNGKAIIGKSANSKSGTLSENILKSWLTKENIKFDIVKNESGVWAEILGVHEKGIDNWEHWNNTPANNPVSKDSVLEGPYVTQWLDSPFNLYHNAMNLVAGGRLFTITDGFDYNIETTENQIVKKQIEDDSLPPKTITVRNGDNGIVLWKRKISVLKAFSPLFIATEKQFFYCEGKDVIILNSETGEEESRISSPAKGNIQWIAIQDEILYMLSGKKIKNCCYADTFSAYSFKSKKMLWTKKGDDLIEPGCVGVSGNSLVYYAPEKKIICRDTVTGNEKWVHDNPKTLKLIQNKKLYKRPWKETKGCSLLVGNGAVYINILFSKNLVALNVDDGTFLWSVAEKMGSSKIASNMLALKEGLFVNIKRFGYIFDYSTGKKTKDVATVLGCGRPTANQNNFFSRSGRFYDRKSNKTAYDSYFRANCYEGPIPANGYLYSGPVDNCRCSFPLNGTLCFTSAKDAFSKLAFEKLDFRKNNNATLKVDEKDWAVYRKNNSRTAGTTVEVELDSKQMWIYNPSSNQKQTRITAAGDFVFSTGASGKVTCVNSKTGKLVWEFITGGQIFFPPAIYEGSAYISSADGFLYSLNAETGELLWRFRAGLTDRKIMLYGRLASAWPANSGVIIHDGIVYFAGGLISQDGTYVYALDAKTGRIRWENDTSSERGIKHGVDVAGSMTIFKGKLWMCGGTAVSPAGYDLKTGKHSTEWDEDRIKLGQGGRTLNGSEIAVFKDKYIIHGGTMLYKLDHKYKDKTFKWDHKRTFAFTAINDKKLPDYPEVSMTCHTETPPAWDKDIYVQAGYGYNRLFAWNASTIDGEIEKIRTTKVKGYKYDGYTYNIDKKKKTTIRIVHTPGEKKPKKLQKWDDELMKFPGVIWGASNITEMVSIAIAGNAVIVAYAKPLDDKFSPKWYLAMLDKKSGTLKKEWQLPSKPSVNGTIINRDGNIIVALDDGGIVSFGK